MVCHVLDVLEHRIQTLVFLISRELVQTPVVKPESLSKTLNHYASSFGWDAKPLVWQLSKKKGFAAVFLV